MGELDPMILPTDLKILNIFTNAQRQTPINIGAELDMDRTYMSERLRYLENQGILRDAPPAERSGMYELTYLGRITAWHATKYSRNSHLTFMRLSRTVNDSQSADSEFTPDLVVLNDNHRKGIRELYRADGLVIPSEFSIDDSDLGELPPPSPLYALYYHGLAERKDGMDVYAITDRGKHAADLCSDPDDPPSHAELTEELREYYTERESELLDTLTSPCFDSLDTPSIRDFE